MTSEVATNPVLVIGATGRHGNTGEHVVRRLRNEGRTVRVLARELSERTDQLIELGADVVVGDLHHRQSLVPALADVDLAYFTYPIAAGVVSASRLLCGGGAGSRTQSAHRTHVDGPGSPEPSQ
jgi:uncharacterized protein YbjT (DUF2867 family)